MRIEHRLNVSPRLSVLSKEHLYDSNNLMTTSLKYKPRDNAVGPGFLFGQKIGVLLRWYFPIFGSHPLSLQEGGGDLIWSPISYLPGDAFHGRGY